MFNIYEASQKTAILIRGGTVQLFHGSVCIVVLESRFRYGSVSLWKNYTVK